MFSNLFKNKPLEITGAAKTVDDLIDGLRLYRPELLITAHRLQDHEADYFLPLVKQRFPGIKILMLTLNCHKDVMVRYVKYLDGMISKEADKSEIWEAINDITNNNKSYFRVNID